MYLIYIILKISLMGFLFLYSSNVIYYSLSFSFIWIFIKVAQFMQNVNINIQVYIFYKRSSKNLTINQHITLKLHSKEWIWRKYEFYSNKTDMYIRLGSSRHIYLLYIFGLVYYQI